jgi:hypothetical protein
MFFPPRVAILRRDILSFQQGEREPLSTAWERFSHLMSSCTVLHLPEHVMLEHFYMGLNKHSTSQLDASFKGSFPHLSVGEGNEIMG